MGSRECITAQRSDGTWTAPACYSSHHANVPEGPIVAIVHTHPAGSSLSLADLRLLARVERIEALTRERRYVARRGPAFNDLDRVYPKVRGQVVASWAASEAAGGMCFETTRHQINLVLARMGIIEYRAGEKEAGR